MRYKSLDVMQSEILTDLKTELAEDGMMNERILRVKVKNAVHEVMSVRNYPSGYSDSMVLSDIQRFIPQIKNIALYDYNQIGIEFQQSSNENGESRSYVSRDSLFYGIIPISVQA